MSDPEDDSADGAMGAEPRKRARRALRWTAAAILAALALLLARPAAHLLRAARDDRPTIRATPAGFADDASRLNATRVREVWPVPPTPALAEQQLADLVRRAAAERIPISIAGARHSMGGHTIAPDGIVINMLPFRGMSLSADGRVLTVQAGALWAEVIPFLNQRGRSVAVMQSDNSFSVGGSLSTNVHGWQARRPPIASTVRSFRLLTASGRIVRCSRTENAELFSLALGGYGLFGVILDAELWTVPNEWYRPQRWVLPADEYADAFQARVEGDSGVVMAYGRVSVAPSAFLTEAILTVYRRGVPPGDPPLPALEKPPLAPLQPVGRTVFRGSVGSRYGKDLRWDLERGLGDDLHPRFLSRNQLLHHSVDLYANRSAERTEVLHEYFLPPRQLAAFLRRAREILPRHGPDLLNVTLRDVRADPDSYLAYAREDVIGAVMLFSQPRTAQADSAMQAMTRELTGAALELGGTYYLPYRPHATAEQFARAYPRAAEFFRQKRRADPGLLFQNRFYLNYGTR